MHIKCAPVLSHCGTFEYSFQVWKCSLEVLEIYFLSSINSSEVLIYSVVAPNMDHSVRNLKTCKDIATFNEISPH